jgi:hypothetical protein
MAKKSNPDKGLPSVTIDGIGTLKWNNEQTRLFEEWALQFLDFPKSGIKTTSAGIVTMDAKFAVLNTMQTASMQTRALWHALRAGQPDITIETIDQMITDYRASGKDWEDLIIAIQRSFLLSNDPSSLASQEANGRAYGKWRISRSKMIAKSEKKNQDQTKEAIKKLTTQLAELDSGDSLQDSGTALD